MLKDKDKGNVVNILIPKLHRDSGNDKTKSNKYLSIHKL